MEALSLDIMLRSLREVGSVVVMIAVFTVVLEAGLYVVLVKFLKHKYALPIMLLAPAAIGLVLLIVYPILYEFRLAFSNMSLNNFKKSYMITDQTVTKLQEAGIPSTVLSALKGFTEQEYPSEEQLITGITVIIGEQQMNQYRDLFIQNAQIQEQFTITESTLEQLQEHQVPEDIGVQLKPLVNQSYPSATELVNALTRVLDQEGVNQFNSVILQSVEKTSIFRFTKRAFLKLRRDLPEEILTALESRKGLINKTYTSEKQFLQDVEKALGSDQLVQYKSAFLTHALANPGPTFGIREGFANFTEIFTQPVLKQVHFFPVLLRTILWTAIQVPTHVILGLGLAILMNRPMKFRGLYRTLIIVPWAIPQVIAVLAWRGEFHSQYGFLNILLGSMRLPGIEWKSDPFWNFVSMNIVNIWLGIPFMMVILLGGLQSISQTYYEAAEVDGATRWNKFRHITLPLIQPVMTPAIILGVIWTFNNFNVPFLINQNELETSDILVTALFRAAFEYNRYGFAAAFALVIFVILLVFCLIYMRTVQLELGLTAGKKKGG